MFIRENDNKEICAMKINVEIVDSVEDIIEGGIDPTCLVDIDDGKGHVIKGIQIQPEFARSGEVTDLNSSECIDDLTLNFDGEKYVSFDTDKEFSSEIVPFFYAINEDGNAEIKDELEEQLIDAINKAVFQYYNEGDEEPSSDDFAYEISCARGKSFLQKYHYVVAYNINGELAKNSIGWEFATFDTKKCAIEFKDIILEKHRNNPYCFAKCYSSDDYEEIGRYLEYNSIAKNHIFC